MAEVTLEFLARQNERLLNDFAMQRDDISVLTAMVVRLETSTGTIVQELRAMQRQIARMNDRVRKLEDAGATSPTFMGDPDVP
jgi:hypothetical protein